MQTEFLTSRQPMKSGAYEASKFVYRKVEADRGEEIWLIPTNSPAPGEQVHVHYPKKKSEGYGGATLTFLLEDGTEYKAQGPWHSNTDHLFQSTGIDLRNQHRTYGCVALRREHTNQFMEDRFTGLLHCDSDWVVGDFNRLRQLGIQFATKLNHPVFVYSQSQGGSSSGMEYPTGTTWQDWKDWEPKELVCP